MTRPHYREGNILIVRQAGIEHTYNLAKIARTCRQTSLKDNISRIARLMVQTFNMLPESRRALALQALVELSGEQRGIESHAALEALILIQKRRLSCVA